MHKISAAKTATFNTASIMLPSTESRLSFEVLICRRPEIFPAIMTDDYPVVRRQERDNDFSCCSACKPRHNGSRQYWDRWAAARGLTLSVLRPCNRLLAQCSLSRRFCPHLIFGAFNSAVSDASQRSKLSPVRSSMHRDCKRLDRMPRRRACRPSLRGVQRRS